MILNVYTLRDRKVGFYATPKYDNVSPSDFAEKFRRGIIADPVTNATLKDCEIYLLGTYDDKLAKFELLTAPEFIEDLSQFFQEVK